jgi:hypothetical protein
MRVVVGVMVVLSVRQGGQCPFFTACPVEVRRHTSAEALGTGPPKPSLPISPVLDCCVDPHLQQRTGAASDHRCDHHNPIERCAIVRGWVVHVLIGGGSYPCCCLRLGSMRGVGLLPRPSGPLTPP